MNKSALLLIVLFSLMLMAAAVAGQSAADQQRYETVPPVRSFQTVEIYIDAGEQELAAYQFELKVVAGEAAIVGVENGAHAAFSEPPYYDPAALQQERIIIADFNTGKDLPRGQTRVTTLHVVITGEVKVEYDVQLTVAADADGSAIPAKISYVQGEQK